MQQPTQGKEPRIAGQRRAPEPMPEPIVVPSWSQQAGGMPWLVHGFSTRFGGLTTVYGGPSKAGDLNLGFTKEDDAKTVEANRARFLQAVCGREKFSLVALKQIHSNLIWKAARNSTKDGVARGDGLLTATPGLLLAVQTADCLPVLLVDRKRRAVAALHAGWRGSLARIVEAAVGRMRMEFGSKPEDMLAAIGPGIGRCCYRVGEEVRERFTSQFAYAAELFREVYESDPIREKYPLLFLTARAPGHGSLGPEIHLDLAEANRRQLLAAGLAPEAIHLAGECTACRPERFFSHRGQHGVTGRMMSAIGIRQS